MPSAATAPVRVGGCGLGHRGGSAGVGRVVADRPGGVVDRGLRALDVDHHVRALVLDGLETADRTAELLAHLGVLDRDVEHLLRAANHLGRKRHLAAIDRGRQHGPSVIDLADHVGRRRLARRET